MNETDTMPLFVEIVDAARGFLPGESLQVNALWALPSAPRSVEVRLCWTTQGKGTVDVEVVASHAVAQPAQAGRESFVFQLPASPYSCSGRLVSLVWLVEIVAEPSGQSANAEFVMGPGRKEVVLDAALNAPST